MVVGERKFPGEEIVVFLCAEDVYELFEGDGGAVVSGTRGDGGRFPSFGLIKDIGEFGVIPIDDSILMGLDEGVEDVVETLNLRNFG